MAIKSGEVKVAGKGNTSIEPNSKPISPWFASKSFTYCWKFAGYSILAFLFLLGLGELGRIPGHFNPGCEPQALPGMLLDEFLYSLPHR
ncbi:MAG: hypothetical protein ACKVH8_16030 [Pirellulales bacterium]